MESIPFRRGRIGRLLFDFALGHGGLCFFLVNGFGRDVCGLRAVRGANAQKLLALSFYGEI